MTTHPFTEQLQNPRVMISDGFPLHLTKTHKIAHI